jgi:hypothetical protein
MVRLTLTGLGILYTGIALPGICPRYTGCPSFSGVAGARNSSRLSPRAAGTSGGGTGCPLAAERAFETSSMSTSEEPGVPCRLRRRSRSSTSSATAYGKDGLQPRVTIGGDVSVMTYAQHRDPARRILRRLRRSRQPARQMSYPSATALVDQVAAKEAYLPASSSSYWLERLEVQRKSRRTRCRVHVQPDDRH